MPRGNKRQRANRKKTTAWIDVYPVDHGKYIYAHLRYGREFPAVQLGRIKWCGGLLDNVLAMAAKKDTDIWTLKRLLAADKSMRDVVYNSKAMWSWRRE